MDKLTPCAGIIVFNTDQTILVSTDRGNFSFPKGKRNKTETNIQAAWRELEEETGLTNDHVRLFNDIYFDEKTDKGYLSVRYFVGVLIKPIDKFKFDKNELANVAWYKIDDAIRIEKFKKSRKDILTDAYLFVKTMNTV